MNNDEFNSVDLILDYPSIYNASKNTSWKKNINEKYTVILRFLAERNLLLINVFDGCGEVKKDLVLREKHLTPIGAEMFREAIPKWQKARDRDQNLANIGLLEKSYQKLINQSPK